MWFKRDRPKASDPAILELVGQIHGLTLRVKHLEETLAALESKYERLRGRFYATRGEGVPAGPQIRSKEQILTDYFAARANKKP